MRFPLSSPLPTGEKDGVRGIPSTVMRMGTVFICSGTRREIFVLQGFEWGFLEVERKEDESKSTH
jgi:hypothetical protein